MTKRKAGLLGTVSFVSGILGFGVLPVIGTIGAIVLGRKARALNSFYGDSPTVTFLAWGGILMGWAQITFVAMFLLLCLGFLALHGFGAIQP